MESVWDIRRLSRIAGALWLNGRPWVSDCRRADSLHARALGLLATRRDVDAPALLIPRCRSVHGIGLRAPLECVFLDQNGVIVGLVTLRPWRFATVSRAVAVLELYPGRWRTPQPGQRVEWSPSS